MGSCFPNQEEKPGPMQWKQSPHHWTTGQVPTLTFKKGPSLVLAHQLHLKFHIVVQSSDVYCASFPCGSAGKESACNVGDLGSIPGLERSPGVGKGYPLQYSGLENSMDQELDTTERLSLSLHFWNSKFKLVSTSL